VAGTTAAAARAGLGKSRYLEARELLIRRGVVHVEDAGGGNGGEIPVWRVRDV
jgi:hypothetical protein